MPIVSNPIIDKLSLTYRCTHAVSEGIREMINGCMRDNQFNLRFLGSFYQGRRYRYNWHLIIENQNRNPILIQIGSTFSNAANLRIEWNPNNLRLEGNQQLWEALELLLCAEYDSFLVDAKVTRIDVAVDVRPLTPDDIWIVAKGLHRGDIRTGDHGRIETMMLGSRKSNLHFCIYNRDPDTRQRISSDPLITRIEAKLKPRCTLKELQLIADNPFRRLTTVDAIGAELGSIPARYIQFIDSVRVRGLQGALAAIPRYETRRDYLAWIEENRITDWFDPDQIWGRYNQALEVLALPEHLRDRRRWVDERMIRARRKAA